MCTCESSGNSSGNTTILANEVWVNPSKKTILVGTWYEYAIADVYPCNATNKNVVWSSSNENVATVHPESGRIYGVSAGCATIYATATDGSGHFDTLALTVVTEIKAEYVSLSSYNIALMAGGSKTLCACICPTNATNQNVNWSSNNESVATVDCNGTIFGHANGTAVITATAADGSGKGASCTVTVTNDMELVTCITVSPSSKTLTVGESFSANVTICPTDAIQKTVCWISSNPNVATVNQKTGHVTAKNAGTATIYATIDDGSNVAGCCTVTVMPKSVKINSITLNKSSLSMGKDSSQTLVATVLPNNATNKELVWKSSNESVVYISQCGCIYAKSKGNATITVTATDGSNKSASCSVTVTDEVLVTSISIGMTNKSPVVEDTTYMRVTVYPTNATNKSVLWSSSNSRRATVDSNSGLFIAQKSGYVTIYAKAQDGSNVEGSYTVYVRDKIPATSVSIVPSNVLLNLRESKRLSATVYPEDTTDKTVIWNSSNEKIVTVGTHTGCIYGISDGTATITARTQDGNCLDCCEVTVKAREKVYIKKSVFNVETNNYYFDIKFSSDLIWHSVGYDLSRTDITIPQTAINRLNSNYEKDFSAKQIAYIYRFDPLGIEQYIKAKSAYKSKTERLFYKDDIYLNIFGQRPKLFRIFPDETIRYYEYGENMSNDLRLDMYSEAEILFGAHVIIDPFSVFTFFVNVLTDLFTSLPVISHIMTGVEIYQALYHSKSIVDFVQNSVTSFINEYMLNKVEDNRGKKCKNIFEWVSNLLVSGLNNAINTFTIPNLNDITIYNKISSQDFQTIFEFDKINLSMEEIIMLSENSNCC